ncbi:hypothetical protein UPYG_G00111020 [Umbra pygmaea]|uniref:Uncharacterized protein n=1 Tax=Umbra pygmaea TaxID=75934 RepID=A0ABD0X3V0_UMBPY
MSNKILGVKQCTLSDLFHGQILRKDNAVCSDSSHPLFPEFQSLLSGSRLRCPSPGGIPINLLTGIWSLFGKQTCATRLLLCSCRCVADRKLGCYL